MLKSCPMHNNPMELVTVAENSIGPWRIPDTGTSIRHLPAALVTLPTGTTPVLHCQGGNITTLHQQATNE